MAPDELYFFHWNNKLLTLRNSDSNLKYYLCKNNYKNE